MSLLRRRPPDPLTEIQRGALDPRSDLPTVLRQCLALGGMQRSEALRTWARSELNGYGEIPRDEVPGYREIPGVVLIDGATRGATFTGYSANAQMLPDFARDILDEPVLITSPLEQVLSMIRHAKADREQSVSISVPGGQQLVPLINQRLDGARVERIYRSLSITALEGIIDVVRTNLVALVAEMRALTPPGGPVPSGPAVDRVVGTVIGFRPTVNVQQVTSGGDINGSVTLGDTTITDAAPEPPSRRVGFWAGLVIAAIGSAATVLTLVLAR